jgi:hypothetical protein
VRRVWRLHPVPPSLTTIATRAHDRHGAQVFKITEQELRVGSLEEAVAARIATRDC